MHRMLMDVMTSKKASRTYFPSTYDTYSTPSTTTIIIFDLDSPDTILEAHCSRQNHDEMFVLRFDGRRAVSELAAATLHNVVVSHCSTFHHQTADINETQKLFRS